MTVVVSARGLTRRLNEGPEEVTLVEDIDLDINKGEFVAVTGPSGCGKSSLLYLLGLLDTPSAGEITLEENKVSGLSSDELSKVRLAKIGFVFQFHFLLPEFTLLENVQIPMRRLGDLSPSACSKRALELLAELGLKDVADRLPGNVSGGQRQRAAIARAVANHPLMLLADEPTGNLDSKNSQLVSDMFRNLVEQHGQTVIMVTHDLGLAEHTDRQIKMLDGRLER